MYGRMEQVWCDKRQMLRWGRLSVENWKDRSWQKTWGIEHISQILIMYVFFLMDIYKSSSLINSLKPICSNFLCEIHKHNILLLSNILFWQLHLYFTQVLYFGILSTPTAISTFCAALKMLWNYLKILASIEQSSKAVVKVSYAYSTSAQNMFWFAYR